MFIVSNVILAEKSNVSNDESEGSRRTSYHKTAEHESHFIGRKSNRIEEKQHRNSDQGEIESRRT